MPFFMSLVVFLGLALAVAFVGMLMSLRPAKS